MLKLVQNQKLKQSLKMQAQFYQAVELMALPVSELRLRILEEVEKNPALEIGESSEARRSVAGNEDSGKPEPEEPEEGAWVKRHLWKSEKSPSRNSSEDHDKRRFLEQTPARGKTLQEHLAEQLSLESLSPKEQERGLRIIRNLDKNGFHVLAPEQLFPGLPYPLLEKLICLIQTLDPVGTAVYNYRESLAVQTREDPEAPPGMAEKIEPFLRMSEEKIRREESREGAGASDDEPKKTADGLSEEDFEEVLRYIRKLTPFPGAGFGSDPEVYIVPDVRIRREGEKINIHLNDESLPVLRISRSFTEEAEEKKEQTPEKKEEKKRSDWSLTKARYFMEAVDRRKTILYKVVEEIMNVQKEFIFTGRNIKPLSLKDLADKLDIHISTVSRITSQKYLQSERGLFRLKYFFSQSLPAAFTEEGQISKSTVKEMILEQMEKFSAETGGAKKISDRQICAHLQEKGIKIARRTVNKYRRELKPEKKQKK